MQRGLDSEKVSIAHSALLSPAKLDREHLPRCRTSTLFLELRKSTGHDRNFASHSGRCATNGAKRSGGSSKFEFGQNCRRRLRRKTGMNEAAGYDQAPTALAALMMEEMEGMKNCELHEIASRLR